MRARGEETKFTVLVFPGYALYPLVQTGLRLDAALGRGKGIMAGYRMFGYGTKKSSWAHCDWFQIVVDF